MKILAIIQARMGSSRLPGKMLMPIIDGKGALELMIERVKRACRIDHIMVATTVDKSDDDLAALCDRLNVACFRGSIEDVLDRFYQAACSIDNNFDGVVRLTGDCPLHDPEVIDTVIERYLAGENDYVSNVHPPTFPDGLDVEVFTFSALEKSWKEAELQYEREHVTQHICRHPDSFSSENVAYVEDLSSHRWTLDEPSDFKFIQCVYKHLYHEDKKCFTMHQILDLIEKFPEIKELNNGIERNEGLQLSICSES